MKIKSALICLSLLVFASLSAQAQTNYTWGGASAGTATTGTWAGANWFTGGGAAGSWADTNNANFLGTSSSTWTVTLNAPVSANNVTFSNSGTGTLLLTSTLTGGLALAGQLTVGASSSVQLGANVSPYTTLPISGAGSIVNSGTLVLTCTNNTFSGGVTLNSGLLEVGRPGASNAVTEPLGSGTLTINGGAISDVGGAGIVIANAVALNSNLAYTGSSGLTFASTTGATNLTSAGPVTLGSGTYSITVSSAANPTVEIKSQITGASSSALIISASNGQVRLDDAFSNFGGGVTLNSGTLELGGTGSGTTGPTGTATAGAIGTGTLTINGGVLGTSANNTGGSVLNLYNHIVVNANFGMLGRQSTPIIYSNIDLGGVVRTINFTIDSVATEDPINYNFSGIISNGGLNLTGSFATVTLAGAYANTYTGLTTLNLTGTSSYVSGSATPTNSNYLVLNRSAAPAIPGNLLITSGTVYEGTSAVSNQIATTSTVDLEPNGFLAISKGAISAGALLTGTGYSQQIAKLVYNAGPGSFTFGTSGSSSLTLGSGLKTNNAIAVTNGGTLSGTGTIGVIVAGKAGGTLAPGKSGGGATLGTLSFTSLVDLSAATSSSTVNINLSLSTGGLSDQVAILTGGTLTGSVNAGSIVLNLTDAGMTAGTGQSFTLINASAATAVNNFTANEFTIGGITSSALTFSNEVLSISGNELLLTLDATTIPEPNTVAMVVSGLGMLITAQRMRRRNA